MEPSVLSRDPALPGLVLTIEPRWSTDLTLRAVVVNEGARTFQVSSICVSPWSQSLTDPQGRARSMTEPEAVCAAFGLKPFAPGEHLWFNATWDERVWTHEEGMHRAPDGDYTWQIHFHVYDGKGIQDPGVAQELIAGVTVRVD